MLSASCTTLVGGTAGHLGGNICSRGGIDYLKELWRTKRMLLEQIVCGGHLYWGDVSSRQCDRLSCPTGQVAAFSLFNEGQLCCDFGDNIGGQRTILQRVRARLTSCAASSTRMYDCSIYPSFGRLGLLSALTTSAKALRSVCRRQPSLLGSRLWAALAGWV